MRQLELRLSCSWQSLHAALALPILVEVSVLSQFNAKKWWAGAIVGILVLLLIAALVNRMDCLQSVDWPLRHRARNVRDECRVSDAHPLAHAQLDRRLMVIWYYRRQSDRVLVSMV